MRVPASQPSSSGFIGCSFAGEWAKSHSTELPKAPGGVSAGLGQGQDENPGWSLLWEFPWSEAAVKQI